MCGKTSKINENKKGSSNPDDYELTWREKQLIANFKSQGSDGWTRKLPTYLVTKLERISVLERKVAESAKISFADFAKTLNTN